MAMQLIRGTTPTITIDIVTEIDLNDVSEIWVYISQTNKVKVDKKLEDVSIDVEHRKVTCRLDQDDTLALKAGEALFQIRLLLTDDTALATKASKVDVLEVYKGGVIAPENEVTDE